MSILRVIGRPATRRTAMRLSADVFGRVLQLVVLVVLARVLDESTFGTLVVGATAGIIASQVADIGLSMVVGADVARSAPASASELSSALRLKALLSAVVLAALALLYPVLGATPAAAGAALVGAGLSFDTFVQFSAMQLRAIAAFRLDWLTVLVPRLLVVIAVVPAALAFPDPRAIGAAWLAAAAGGAAVAVAVLRGQIRFGPASIGTGRMLLQRAWPIGSSIIVSMLYTRVAIFMLEWLRSSSDVAQYAVALRFLEPMYMVPAAMAAVFYPAYAKALGDAPDAASGMLAKWAAATATLGFAAYVGIALLGTPLAIALFGPSFALAGDLLKILGLVLLPGFVSFLLNQALIARGSARYNLSVMVVLLVITVLANRWAIEAYGVWGAAGVAVAAEVLLLAALARRLLGGRVEAAYA